MNFAARTLVLLALVSCTVAQAPAPGPAMTFDINVNINVEGFHASLNGSNLLGNPLGLIAVRRGRGVRWGGGWDCPEASTVVTMLLRAVLPGTVVPGSGSCTS